MFKFFVITFVASGRQAVMRTRVFGGHEVALLQASGEFHVVGEISEPFTAQEIRFQR